MSAKTIKEKKWVGKVAKRTQDKWKKAAPKFKKARQKIIDEEADKNIFEQVFQSDAFKKWGRLKNIQKNTIKKLKKDVKKDVGLIEEYGVGETSPQSDARKAKSFMTSRKKSGGKVITYRMTGGQVVASSYD